MPRRGEVKVKYEQRPDHLAGLPGCAWLVYGTYQAASKTGTPFLVCIVTTASEPVAEIARNSPKDAEDQPLACAPNNGRYAVVLSPENPRMKIGQVSNGFRTNIVQRSDNSRTQNELTSLEVRRAVWNGACYGCLLLWQGEQRPSLNQPSFHRRCVSPSSNLAAFPPAAFDAPHGFLSSSHCARLRTIPPTEKGRVSVMVAFLLLAEKPCQRLIFVCISRAMVGVSVRDCRSRHSGSSCHLSLSVLGRMI